MLTALFLASADNLRAQNEPSLTVSVDDIDRLEGQSATIRIALSAAPTQETEYCFAARHLGNAVTWDLTDSTPASGTWVEVKDSFGVGERVHTLTVASTADGVQDSSNDRFEISLNPAAETGVTLSCDRSGYTVGASGASGHVRFHDDYKFYESLTITVNNRSNSIYEGGRAEFYFTRTGGIMDNGSLVVGPTEGPATLQFEIGETGYVFTAGLAPWRLKGGSAYNQGNYKTETFSATFPAGNSELAIEVDTSNDRIPDAANTSIDLSLVAGTANTPYNIGSPSSASVPVMDLGDTPVIRFAPNLTDTAVDESDRYVEFALQHVLTSAAVAVELQLTSTGAFLATAPSVQVGVWRSASEPFKDPVTVTPTAAANGHTFSVAFAEGDADSVTRIVRIGLVDDDVAEADGSVTLTAPAQHGAASVTATATVTDDELPTVTLTTTATSVAEGGSATFTLTRNGDTSETLVILAQHLISNTYPAVTSDHANHKVTFAAGDTTQTITVSVAEDQLFYYNRQLQVNLSRNASSPYILPDPPPTGAHSGSDEDKTVYHLPVTDNDKGELSVSAGTSPVSESNEACFRLDVQDFVFHPFQAYTLDFNLSVTQTGSFVDADQQTTFTHQISQVDEIESNDTDYDVCIDLDDDDLDEAAGTVSLEITGPNNTDVAPATNATATVAVQDNDLPVVTVSIDSLPVPDDGEVPVKFTRQGDLTDRLVVPATQFEVERVFPAAAGRTADGSTESNVVFGPGRATATWNHTFGDTTYWPGRLYQVTLKALEDHYRVPSTLPDNAVAALSSATETVYQFAMAENDTGYLSVRPATPVVAESGRACFDLSMALSYIISSITADIEISQTGDVLAASQDTELNLTVDSLPHRFCVDLDNDSVSESNGSVTATLSAVSNTSIKPHPSYLTATVTVTDNELPLITLTTTAASAPEGGTVNFTLTRTGDLTSAFTIPNRYFRYWVDRPNETKTVTSGTLTFPVGQASIQTSASVLDDSRYYPTAALVATLRIAPDDDAPTTATTLFALPSPAPAGATGDNTSTTWRLPLQDNDRVGLRVIGNDGTTPISSLSEDAGPVCFEVSAEFVWDRNFDQSVPYTLSVVETGRYLADGDQSIAGELYSSAAGDDVLVQQHCLDLDDDTVSEYDGAVTASFSHIGNPDFVSHATKGTAVVTILDNEDDLVDSVDVQLVEVRSQAPENKEVTVRVQRWHGGDSNAPTTQEVTVTLKSTATGDFWTAPAERTYTTTIKGGDEYVDVSLRGYSSLYYVKNWTMQVTLNTGTGYRIRNGHDSLSLPIVNDQLVQKVGFYRFEENGGPLQEGSGRQNFKLRRNYHDQDSNYRDLRVKVKVTEQPMVDYLESANGTQNLFEIQEYGARAPGTRRQGSHLGSSNGEVTEAYFLFDDVEDIPFTVTDDDLEETPSVITAEILGGLGYEVIEGVEFGQDCDGNTRGFGAGCGRMSTWVVDGEKYEHWFKVSPVGDDSIEEGDDIVFRIERFATQATHRGLHREPVRPICTLTDPESATKIPVGNLDFRKVRFAVSGHRGVVSTNFPLSIDFAPGQESAELRLPTSDDNTKEDHAQVQIRLLGRDSGTNHEKYYCRVPGSGSATVEVEDNDSDPAFTVSIDPDEIQENGGQRDITVTVTLGEAASRDLSLDLRQSRRPASRPGDARDESGLRRDRADARTQGGHQHRRHLGHGDSEDPARERPAGGRGRDADGDRRPARHRHRGARGPDHRGQRRRRDGEPHDTVGDGGRDHRRVVLHRPGEPAGRKRRDRFRGVSGTDLTITPSSHTFTDTNWNQAQQFQVTAASDDDADDESVTIDPVASSGGAYARLDFAEVAVTIVDDDSVAVLVSPTELTLAEGAQGQYTLVLDSKPTGSVVITANVNSRTDGSIGSFTRTFTTANWHQTQTVSFAAPQDPDGADDIVVIRHTAAGGGYDDANVASVAITINDDETESRAVDLSVNTATLSEAAGATTVTVTATLDEAPLAADKTLSLYVEGPPPRPRLRQRGGLQPDHRRGLQLRHDDLHVDADERRRGRGRRDAHRERHGRRPHGQPATITIEDDDTRGVSISPTTLTVDEGGSGTYTVVLNSTPTGTVTVTPSVTGSPDVTLNETALTFTSSTWSTAQTVTVSAAEDDDGEAEEATVSHEVAGGDYGSVTASEVAVTVRRTRRPRRRSRWLCRRRACRRLTATPT